MPARAPAPSPVPAPASRSTGIRPGPIAIWALALAAPVVPLAVIVLAHVTVAPEVQRLALLVVVALIGVAFGTAPALLSAVVAVALGWFRPELTRWVLDPRADTPTLIAFAVAALVVAVVAGARRAAVVLARAIFARLDGAEREAVARRQEAQRLATEAATLRADRDRADRELVDARAAAARAERARRAILDSLPPELRAPHVVVPTALQLFPPLLAASPIGVAPPAPAPRDDAA